MKADFLFPLAVAALLAGCATAPKSDVYTYRTDVGGPPVDLIVDNELDSGDKPTELIWLNASRIRQGAWNAKYYLEVRYEALPQTGLLDIAPGETLVLTVDGQTMKFGGVGSLNERKEGRSTLVEHAIYEAKVDDLRKIAKAKEVKVDIAGSQRTVHREFKPANIEKFRNFVLTYTGF
ncbi:MAG TPA: hypothetical protein VEL06_01905 [Haliangiales bacterium]|nr:hypothetical protein [Haliangiales bacterium]